MHEPHLPKSGAGHETVLSVQSGLLVSARCAPVSPRSGFALRPTSCSPECQRFDWSFHKKSCGVPPKPIVARSPTDPVDACFMFSAGDKRGHLFDTLSIPADHPIFSAGTLSPLSVMMELPLLIYREDRRPSLSIPRSAAMDNQAATYLMFDTKTGFAPPEWQQGIGTVIVARQDGKPLDELHLEMIWSFASDLLDAFGDSGVVADRKKGRKAFEMYMQNYRMNHEGIPRWEALPSPYEI